jgi:hypothetical protein
VIAAAPLRSVFAALLAAWMAVLPVLGALATTHGALDAVRSLAADAVAAPDCDTASFREPRRGHDASDGPVAHVDSGSSFAHELAHAWDCCAQSVATLPMLLHRLPSLRPDAPAVQRVMAVILPRLDTLLRPPIR